MVSCSTVFTGMHELARRFGAVLAFSEVPAWFLAWMNTGLSLSVVDCVWSLETELLLLLTVGARVVWGTKIKLIPGLPLVGWWRGLAELLAHKGHGLMGEQRIVLGMFFGFALGNRVAWGVAVLAYRERVVDEMLVT